MPTIPSRSVSGRYRGLDGDVEVELRIDVDGERPTNRVSADYSRAEGQDTAYLGSMCIDAPRVTRTASLVTITGTSRSTLATDAPIFKITIACGLPGAQPASATVIRSTRDGRPRRRFRCTYEAASFRTVLLEEDTEQGVRRFESYDTGALASPAPARRLSHVSAFADAGIELHRTREPGVIPSSRTTSWSDAELHAAMVQRFTAFGDVPRWAIWMLHARRHESDAIGRGTLLGLMFDQRGRQRQGCALFYEGFAGTSPQRQRLQLLTAVHELAHGFNLLHSFEKSLANPPLPSRPRSATWMAYPHLFPDGEAAFWARFHFQFDDPECVHLRHAFRDDAIMGGNPFTAGAAFELDVDEALVSRDDPGLRLKLSAPPALPYGVPVTVDLELSATRREGHLVPGVLGPRARNVDLTIRAPDGTDLAFEPLLRHCRVDDMVRLRAGDPPVRGSAFIHYGRNGFAFDRPGRYEIRARCSIPDGSRVVSNLVRIDVRAPATRADSAVAALAFGEQQGVLMSLVGSDAPELGQGNEALRTIIERYPNHPVASVARIVTATNAAREFKTIQLDGSVLVRPPQPQEAVAILRGAPGLEALRRAAVSTGDVAALPQLVLALMPRLPTDRTTALSLQPFVRSRIDEIAVAVPPAIAREQARLAAGGLFGSAVTPRSVPRPR
ncbi:MAG: hypothetical protein QOG94_3770 [Solirubrobacteraceae bacterium]|jgi:hypothetical protein|nr:hypothetical protein [Solirubrobacteraceae bacterium]